MISSGRKTSVYVGYFKAEQKSHKLTKWFTLFVMLFFTFGTILYSLLLSFWNIYNHNFDSVTWWLPINTQFSVVDKSSLIGWYFELLMDALCGYAFVLTMTSTVTFFGACSFYIEACCSQLKHMFAQLDDMAKKKRNNHVTHLSEIVVFHNTIVEYVLYFNFISGKFLITKI